MTRTACWMGVLLAVGLLTGCVERKYVITSDPPGAIVYRNGQYLGATPVDDHFVYFGKYHFTLVRDGYETLQVDEPIPTPWYEWPGLDFFSETAWPFTVKDEHRFHYQMQPMQLPRTDEVLEHAEQLRAKGKLLGPLPGTQPQPESQSKSRTQQKPIAKPPANVAPQSETLPQP